MPSEYYKVDFERAPVPARPTRLDAFLLDVYLFRSLDEKERAAFVAIAMSGRTSTRADRDFAEFRQLIGARGLSRKVESGSAWLYPSRSGHSGRQSRARMDEAYYAIRNSLIHTALYDDPVPFEGEYPAERQADPVVRLSSLLRKGSIFLAGLCTFSLLYWAASGVIVLNPLLSLLGMIAMPFVYLMGRYVESGWTRNGDADKRI